MKLSRNSVAEWKPLQWQSDRELIAWPHSLFADGAGWALSPAPLSLCLLSILDILVPAPVGLVLHTQPWWPTATGSSAAGRSDLRKMLASLCGPELYWAAGFAQGPGTGAVVGQDRSGSCRPGDLGDGEAPGWRMLAETIRVLTLVLYFFSPPQQGVQSNVGSN